MFIGLLHGLGFFRSAQDSRGNLPDIWKSLLASNVGIEFGQLAIIFATWLLFRLLQKLSSQAWKYCRNGLALTSVSIGSYWALERISTIVN